MQVNGKSYAHTPGLTLHALLTALGASPQRVAVAVNDTFYPGAQAPDVPLEPHDVIEVVRVMAGG